MELAEFEMQAGAMDTADLFELAASITSAEGPRVYLSRPVIRAQLSICGCASLRESSEGRLYARLLDPEPGTPRVGPVYDSWRLD